MSVNAEDELEEVAAEAGWNKRVKLSMACKFIDEHELAEEFRAWLEEQTTDEDADDGVGSDDDWYGREDDE
jgi:hypothetical protein